MSKIKMSFSLILAIFLVGILSTAAFAKDPYGLKPVSQRDLSLLVPFNGNTADSTDYNPATATTSASYNPISFDVVLKDASGSIVGLPTAYQGTISTSTGKGSVTIPAGVMTPGANYTVELYKTADTAHANLLSKSTAVVLDGHNVDMYKANGTAAAGNLSNSTNVDVTGSGLKNDNLTGYDNTRKNRSGQSIHGFYQNNTNSCASCHQAHTAANGESLLFKDGVYSTCSACHDGTTGAYNSFAPVDPSMTSSIDGTFNVQTAGHNGSLHQADGSLKISAAPGGNVGATTGPYSQEFDCASCHAAHGAGSNGENNLNTDPMGWGSVPYSNTVGQTISYFAGHSQTSIVTTTDNKNGKLFFNIPIVDGVSNIPTTLGNNPPYILVKTTAAASDITSQTNPSTTSGNYFWSRAGVHSGDQVIQTYRWNGTKYIADYSLWNRELGYPQVANTLLKDSTGKDLTMDPNLTIVWRDGFAFGSSAANVASANVSIGIDVETTNNIQSLYNSSYKAYDKNGNPVVTQSYIPDSGTEMSKYCASCHVDYLSTTRTDNTGVYTTAHRHATLRDDLTCVRCHYGHGSEAQIMHDANDNTFYTLTAPGKVFDSSVTGNTDKAISYFADPNPSSALKRYTGMSVCYACHGEGEQFIGNPNTNKPDTTTGEFLKGGQPGTTRTDISNPNDVK